MFEHLILPLGIGSVLVAATIFIHYESLRLTSGIVPRLRLPLRMRVLWIVATCFAAHSVEVWIYAFTFDALNAAGLGRLEGAHADNSFAEYLYFSVTSYSTLGFGDVYPIGTFRIISGIEALNGLFLIAWSTSFTYLTMEKLWPMHLRERYGGRGGAEPTGEKSPTDC